MRGLSSMCCAALVVAVACGGKGQSLREGAAILCATDEEAGVENVHPAERLAARSRWIAARLKHREVRALFERMADMSPKERTAAITELMVKAKLSSCAADPPRPAFADLALAEIGGTGTEPIDDHDGITIVGDGRAILVEGEAVVAIEGGEVPAAEHEDGVRNALELPRLRRFLESLTKVRATQDRPGADGAAPKLLVLLTRESSYDLLIEILFTASEAGYTQVRLGARRGEALVAIPVQLPRRDESTSGGAAVEMVVAVTRNELFLYSLAGLEGSLDKPRLRHQGHGPDALAALRTSLVEIADRRPGERRIIGQFDSATAMQTVLAVLATVRARDDGADLLPDVVLSAGYR